VTGAGTSLVRVIALALAEAGDRVVAIDLDADAVAQIASGRDPIGTTVADIREPDAVEGAFPERVDVLVNAPGVGGWARRSRIRTVLAADGGYLAQ
jgi:3-hydroxybutyrate dehydrogenase